MEVPHENLVGEEEGKGFFHMHGLARERLTIAVSSLAKSEERLRDLAYAAERELFHKKLTDFQNTQFKLAEVQTRLTVGRCLVDRLTGGLPEQQPERRHGSGGEALDHGNAGPNRGYLSAAIRWLGLYVGVSHCPRICGSPR